MDQNLRRVPVVPGMSIITVKLIEALKDGNIGDVKSDDELTAICGQDVSVDGKGYGKLMTAIRYCRRNHAKNWERVKKEKAIKCLDNSETIASARSGIRRIGRASYREIVKLGTIDTNRLADKDKTNYLTSMAQLGVLHEQASANTAKRLTAQNKNEQLRLVQEESLKKMG